MRFREVFKYEFGYRARSATTWAYALFLIAIAFWMVNAVADADAPVHLNAPSRLAESSALFCGMFGTLVTAGLFSDAAIRDIAVGMDPLLFTTRLQKAEYLGGRFLAALAINSILLLAIPIGLAFATKMPYLEQGAFGPNRIIAYLQPLFLFLLPNLVLVGAILFTIAALARQVIPVYLGAIGIFISYIVAANYWSTIESPTLSLFADPLGINALSAMTKHWTAAERNTRLVGFPAALVWNRVLWLAIAAVLFAVLHRTYKFAHEEGGGRRRKGQRAIVSAPSEVRWSGAVPQVAGVFGLWTRVRQTLAVARQSLAEIMSSRSFKVAFVGAIGLVLLWGWNVSETVFDTSTWPVTHLVVATVLSQRAVIIPWLVIALYAGELVWKDREVGAAEIADAVPVPTGIALLGRFLALVAIIVTFQVAFIIGGLLIQSLQGYYNFELGLYFRILFGFNLADFLLLGALAMTAHVLVNQKYLGYMLVIMASLFKLAAAAFGIHNLLVYNSAPRWRYSDMNGFGPFVAPFVWFKLYWAAWALLLAVIALLFWVRGRELGVRSRFTTAGARFRGRTTLAAGVAITLIVVVGGFVFYNTNVLNAYEREETAGLPQAEYERRYARFEASPQPAITSADLRVEIYPDQPAVDLRGSYRLVNRTTTAIDSVHVVVDREIEVRSLSLDRASSPALVDAERGYRILALTQKLEPGDSVRLTFDVAFRPRGFPNSGIQTSVVGNGAYFDRRWLPLIGYQPWFELQNGPARKRFGLDPKPAAPGPDNVAARQYDDPIRNEEHIRVHTVVGTASDQIAVTPGELRRTWTENGRRYFEYADDVPTSFGAAVFSAKYAVLEDTWNSVALKIFHHPAHRYNLDRMLAGMKASLDYFTKNFGPFSYHQLRIAEIPPYGVFGRAHPATIAFGEDMFITRVKPGEIDQAFYGTAHEVAHHWWGGQARGADVRGRVFLTESLANYSATMVCEKAFGPEVARRIYGFHMDHYFNSRANIANEVPLIQVEDQPYIAYRKGAIAMLTLRDQLGEDAVNTALRRYLEKYRDTGPPYPTSLDLLAELRAVTPDSLRYLLTDLFETVTLWDVKTERAAVKKTNTGEYEVTLDVVAKKLRADRVGHEVEAPMDDLVDIGVFAAEKDDGLGAPLYLRRQRIRSGKQTIHITVSAEPSRAGVDPYHKLIERESGDNVVAVNAGAKTQ